MIFTESDKLYHEKMFNDICNKCNKQSKEKVRDNCHETCQNRRPAGKMCKITHKQQNIIPVVLHNVICYDFLIIFNGYSRKAIALVSANGEAKRLNVSYLKFIDSYNFLSMSLDNMAKTYQRSRFMDGCESNALYPSH